jgi:drug/metabolite transporter (DMT)-like permease
MNFLKITDEKTKAWLLLIACAFIWGASFILIKKGLETYAPDQVGTIRVFFAFLVMLPFAVYKLKTVYIFYWKKLLFLGLLANLLPAIMFATAQTEISSSISGILNSLTPIFTLIVGVLFFRGKMKGGQILGLLIGFAGTLGLIFVNNTGGLGNFNYYALLIILATLFYGISANYIKANLSHIHSITLTSLAMFAIGPLALLYLLVNTDFIHRLTNLPGAWESLGYLFILGAIGTAFALVLFNRLIQMTSAVFASSVTYLIPIMAVIWGVIDGESLFPLHFVGMGLIIAGVYIVNRFR